MLISRYHLPKAAVCVLTSKRYFLLKDFSIRLPCLKFFVIHFLLFLLAVMMSSRVTAQGDPPAFSCDMFLSGNYCPLNLTNAITGLTIDSILEISYAGTPTTDFKDVLYEKDQKKCEPSYSGGNTCTNSSTAMSTLKFAVYYPSKYNGNDLKTCKLPAVILFHGGSFFECSKYIVDGTRDFCRELAKRGFVVFTVEYRRGVILHGEFVGDYQYISAQQVLGIYRAFQDGRGAIRSIIKMIRDGLNGFNSTFSIDTNRLFLAGFSAGSMISLAAAYYERQSQVDSAYPVYPGSSPLSTVLGPLDAPWYVGGADINYKPLIKGVLNMWGGFLMHKSFYNNPKSFFQQNIYHPPMIAFQGMQDHTFPVGKEYQYFSAKVYNGVNYQEETSCLYSGSSFKLPDDDPDPMDITQNADAFSIGADSMHSIFHSLNKDIEVNLDCQMGHGLSKPTETFVSNFGTSYTDEHGVNVYMTGRAATYFIGILNGIVSSFSRTRFLECTNDRVKCNTNSPSGCSYSAGSENGALCE